MYDIKMRKLGKAGFTVLIAIAFLAFPSLAIGATTPIGAVAVYVEGEPTVFSNKDSKTYIIKKGTGFLEGDRVITGAKGIVEIEFDTGDLIRIDKNTDMSLKALNRNEKGSTKSIFSILVGRVKSAVSRLVDKDSKFEYHTKAAIAGVSGTPPFFVSFTNGRAEVDLTGEVGEEGSVYINGVEPGQGAVVIFPGFRTFAVVGGHVQDQFRISAERMKQFLVNMPFRVSPRSKSRAPDIERSSRGSDEGQSDDTNDLDPVDQYPAGGNGSGEGGDGSGEGGDGSGADGQGSASGGYGAGRGSGGGEQGVWQGAPTVVNTINRGVTSPRQPSPGNINGGVQGDDNPRDQGIIGDSAESSGANDAPPSTTVNVIINLK